MSVPPRARSEGARSQLRWLLFLFLAAGSLSAAAGLLADDDWRSPGRQFVPDGAITGTNSVVENEPRAQLVKDIDEREYTLGSDPAGLASIGNMTLFAATTEEEGAELWRTDGTEEGTALVRDIWPGPAGAMELKDRILYPARVVGSRVVFTATDGEHGTELWASDGTREGTVLLSDINPGPRSTVLTFGEVVGSVLYFRAEQPDTGYELWSTDGTAAGTKMVVDLNPGPAGAVHDRSILDRFGSLVVFYGFDGKRSGLFTTDGTSKGTRFLAPADDSYFGAEFGDTFLFASRGGAGLSWSLMQNRSGSARALRGGFTASPRLLTTSSGVAFFVADDGVHGDEVWRTDGTPEGTTLLTDLTPGAAGTIVHELTLVGDRVLISSPGGLWSSGRTPGETPQLLSSTGNPWTGCVVGNRYFFLAWRYPVLGLMTTDGTLAGTRAATGETEGISVAGGALIPRGDGVLLSAKERPGGYEPWISDGTLSGTRPVKAIAPRKTKSSSPYALHPVGNQLFFRAENPRPDGDLEVGVWRSDGTAEGTSLLAGSPVGAPTKATASGGFYYFTQSTADATRLWRTDGSVEGTQPLAEVDPREALVPFRNGLLFWAAASEDDLDGARFRVAYELWFTDGSKGGTKLLARLAPSWRDETLETQTIVVIDDVAFFGIESQYPFSSGLIHRSQVWMTDGTLAGTRLFSEEGLTGPQGHPRGFTRRGDWIYFIAPYSHELWRMKRDSGETFVVRRFESGLGPLFEVRGSLLFFVNAQLWRSDGTPEGTSIVRTDVPSVQTALVGNDLLFWSREKGDATELWRSDGTAAGTFLLQVIAGRWSRIDDDSPLAFSGGRLYFPGADAIYGMEPWVSDGTVEGTHMLVDLVPGIRSSSPTSFVRMGDSLYVSAEGSDVGRELWKIRIACESDCRARRRAVGH